MDITYKDLDNTFIGSLSLNILDSHHQTKAGSSTYSGAIRSQIDRNKNIIRFIGYLPLRTGSTILTISGFQYINGKITERYRTNYVNNTLQFVPVLFLREVSIDIIRDAEIYNKDNNIYTFIGKCEFDDLLFNLNDTDFTFDVTYFITKKKGESTFHSLIIEIPIEKFNMYVQARDNWYRHYSGSSTII